MLHYEANSRRVLKKQLDFKLSSDESVLILFSTSQCLSPFSGITWQPEVAITPVRFGSWGTGSVFTRSPPTRTFCLPSASNVNSPHLFHHFRNMTVFLKWYSFAYSHRRTLPVDWSIWQHSKSLESPGLDAVEDVGRTRGEGDGHRHVPWWKTDCHQLLWPNL